MSDFIADFEKKCEFDKQFLRFQDCSIHVDRNETMHEIDVQRFGKYGCKVNSLSS